MVPGHPLLLLCYFSSVRFFSMHTLMSHYIHQSKTDYLRSICYVLGSCILQFVSWGNENEECYQTVERMAPGSKGAVCVGKISR